MNLNPIFAETGLSDIRDIVESPALWPWWVAAALLLIAAGFILWRLRSRSSAEASAEPVEPPDLKALRLLDQLQRDGDQLDGETFTVEISRVLRHYLEEALDLPAPEQTSEEFLQELRGEDWTTPALQQTLEDFMRLSDLVKFARQSLGSEQRRRLLESARTVVTATRPAKQTEPEEAVS